MVIRGLDPEVKPIRAWDGNEASHAYQTTEDFDAILLDLNMPMVNSLECLSKIKKLYSYHL
jgi:CheY-like chemotaxis protein